MNQSVLNILLNTQAIAEKPAITKAANKANAPEFDKVLKSSVAKITDKTSGDKHAEYARYLIGHTSIDNQAANTAPVEGQAIETAPTLIDQPLSLNIKASGQAMADIMQPVEQVESIKIGFAEIAKLLQNSDSSAKIDLSKLMAAIGDDKQLPDDLKSLLLSLKTTSQTTSNSLSSPALKLDGLAKLAANVTAETKLTTLSDASIKLPQETEATQISGSKAAFDGTEAIVKASDLLKKPEADANIVINKEDGSKTQADVTVKDLKALISKYPDKVFVEIQTKPLPKSLPQIPVNTDVVKNNSLSMKPTPAVIIDLKQLATTEPVFEVTAFIKQKILTLDQVVKPQTTSPDKGEGYKSAIGSNEDTSLKLANDRPSVNNVKASQQKAERNNSEPAKISQNIEQTSEPIGKIGVAKAATTGQVINTETELANIEAIKTEQINLIQDNKAVLIPGSIQKQVISQIEELASRMQMRFNSIGGNSQMLLYLKPETLGKVIIDLKYRNDKVEAVFRVDNPAVKQIIENELPKLRLDMKFDECRVELNNSGQQSNPRYASDRNARTRMFNRSEYKNEKNSSKINNSIVNQAQANIYGGAIDMVA